MDGALENVIVAALDELEQGYTVEEILERYPQKRAELRPILETASGLTALKATPSPEARNASRSEFLTEAARLREASGPKRSVPTWRRFFYSFASFALFLMLIGVIVIPPSSEAIPGDLLYPVKRSVEVAQLILVHVLEPLLAIRLLFLVLRDVSGAVEHALCRIDVGSRHLFSL